MFKHHLTNKHGDLLGLPLDLLTIPSQVRSYTTTVEFISKLSQVHEHTHAQLIATTKKYKL